MNSKRTIYNLLLIFIALIGTELIYAGDVKELWKIENNQVKGIAGQEISISSNNSSLYCYRTGVLKITNKKAVLDKSFTGVAKYENDSLLVTIDATEKKVKTYNINTKKLTELDYSFIEEEDFTISYKNSSYSSKYICLFKNMTGEAVVYNLVTKEKVLSFSSDLNSMCGRLYITPDQKRVIGLYGYDLFIYDLETKEQLMSTSIKVLGGGVLDIEYLDDSVFVVYNDVANFINISDGSIVKTLMENAYKMANKVRGTNSLIRIDTNEFYDYKADKIVYLDKFPKYSAFLCVNGTDTCYYENDHEYNGNYQHIRKTDYGTGKIDTLISFLIVDTLYGGKNYSNIAILDNRNEAFIANNHYSITPLKMLQSSEAYNFDGLVSKSDVEVYSPTEIYYTAKVKDNAKDSFALIIQDVTNNKITKRYKIVDSCSVNSTCEYYSVYPDKTVYDIVSAAKVFQSSNSTSWVRGGSRMAYTKKTENSDYDIRILPDTNVVYEINWYNMMYSVASKSDTLIAIGDGIKSEAILLNLKTKVTQSIEVKSLNSVYLSKDDKYLCTYTYNGDLTFYDVKDLKEVLKFNLGKSESDIKINLSPSFKYLFVREYGIKCYSIDFAKSAVTDNKLDIGIKLFPNPASNIINVNNDDQNMSNIEIYDAQGKLWKTIENAGNTSIDVSDLPIGAYFAKFNISGVSISKSFSVIR